MINEPEKANTEILDEDKISLKGKASIRLALEDQMFYQGTDSFEYTVRLSDFNAKDEYFDYAGFGFELPEGFTVDPDSLKTNLKGNVRYIAAGSNVALAIAAKADGYSANGGYVTFRGVETRTLDADAELFTVKINVADTVKGCFHKIGVSALYGRLNENSKFVDNGRVEPHVSLIDNNAGDQLYTREASNVLMGIKGDVNLDGKVSQVDATVILREILSLEVLKKSELAEQIELNGASEEDAVKLSHFLGNVNQSPNGLFTQIDATSILRARLIADVEGDGFVTEKIWKEVTKNTLNKTKE